MNHKKDKHKRNDVIGMMSLHHVMLLLSWWTLGQGRVDFVVRHRRDRILTPVDTLRTNWEQLSNLFTKYPGGKFWICSECAHHFDHTLITGQIENLISKNPSIYPVGVLSQNPGVSFIICPQHVWATHQKFFHKLSSTCSGICPLGFFQYILNLISIWSIFPQTLN